MFSPEERRLLGRVVFDAWSDAEFAARLLKDPNAILGARGIRDANGARYVTLVDTEERINMVLPWMPADSDPDGLTPAELDALATGVIRIDLNETEKAAMVRLLTYVWASPNAAIAVLRDPHHALHPVLSKDTWQQIGERRIQAVADTTDVVHFVIPLAPDGIKRSIEDLASLNFHVLHSACISVP